jgi:hypothetical protein
MGTNETVTVMKRLNRVLISWDFGISVLITVGLAILIQKDLSVNIVKDVLGVCVSVLAIVFSVFFAALAVLITAGDNEFVKFLEIDGSYTEIIWTFKFSLLILFFALILSIVLFIGVLPYINVQQNYYFPKPLLYAFTFFTVYALFAAVSSSLDAIKYAEYRAKYINIHS